MTDLISETTRGRLAASLVLVQANRDALIAGMGRALLFSEGRDEPFGQAELAAGSLVDFLIGEARHLVSEGSTGNLADHVAEQSSLGLDGRHYSRFGDALMPVMRDVLGPSFPADMAGAWIDTFWTLVRTVLVTRQTEEEPVSA